MIDAIARWVLAQYGADHPEAEGAFARLVDWVFADTENWAYAEREGFKAAWRAMEREVRS